MRATQELVHHGALLRQQDELLGVEALRQIFSGAKGPEIDFMKKGRQLLEVSLLKQALGTNHDAVLTLPCGSERLIRPVTFGQELCNLVSLHSLPLVATHDDLVVQQDSQRLQLEPEGQQCSR